MILSAIHWNVDPVMMHLGPTTLRVVGVLCVAVLLYILAMPLFSKDKKDKDGKEKKEKRDAWDYLLMALIPAVLAFICFKTDSFNMRWYSMGFLVAFVLGYWIMSRMFKREGVKSDYLESLVIYMFLATLVAWATASSTSPATSSPPSTGLRLCGPSATASSRASRAWPATARPSAS